MVVLLERWMMMGKPVALPDEDRRADATQPARSESEWSVEAAVSGAFW